jgi:hypothetical protein
MRGIHGVDARRRNIDTCESKADGLSNVTYEVANALDVSSEIYPAFDVVLVAGLFYHLSFEENVKVLRNTLELSKRVLIIDSNYCTTNEAVLVHWNGNLYDGRFNEEFPTPISQEEMETHLRYRYETEMTKAPSWTPTVDSALDLIRALGVKTVFRYMVAPDINPLFYNPSPRKDKGQMWTRLQNPRRCVFVVFPPSQKVVPRTGPFLEMPETNPGAQVGDKGLDYVISTIMAEIYEIENKKNALALLDELFQSVSPSCYKYVYLGLLEHQYPIPLIIRSRIYLDAMARKRIKNDAAFCSFVAYHHLRTTDSYLAKDLIDSIVNVLTPYFNSPWLDILKALGREDFNATGVIARHCDELAAEYEALPRTHFRNIASILPPLQ